MKRKHIASLLIVLASIFVAGVAPAQDKYTVKVPGGLAFSEFRGYESWEVVSVSEDGGLLAVIVANPVMIGAYKAGVPANGKPVPDGARMAKIHYNPKKSETFPAATVPGTSGVLKYTNVAVTDGANIDSLAVGEHFRIRIKRDVANDTATGDLELFSVEMRET